MSFGRTIVLAAAVSLAISHANAAEGCASPESGLSGPLTAWTGQKARAVTAHSAADVERTKIEVGKRTSLTMAARAGVTFIVPTGGADQPAQYNYSGLASFQVPQDGTYSVATDEGMRIDVVQNGALAQSTAFGRGPQCSSIGKRSSFR